jgi:hypothetical protein
MEPYLIILVTGKAMDIKKAIEAINIDIDKIADPTLRVIIIQLLNIIEAQAKENAQLREENQKLRDENSRLKGEQGKPDIRSQKKEPKDVSSEKERGRNNTEKKKKKSKHKKNKIKIDRMVKLEVDKAQLPADAMFKGYQPVIVQDIFIKADNIEFQKECFYSPSLNKSFLAPLPDGYQGEFGPNIKALIISLHYDAKMTEPAIAAFLKTHGVFISGSTVSRFITDNHDAFHQEKKDIITAGLPSTTYQQMDDTGARVNGINNYTHILCNEFYTAYFTRQHKDRLTILEILAQGELKFRFDESSYAIMEDMKLPQKTLDSLEQQVFKTVMNRKQLDNLLAKLFPDPKTHQLSRHIIVEASAIAAYQELPHAIKILLTDDAPQFKQITELLGLCWVHDGRHYKKLEPVISLHTKKLEKFLGAYWEYYHKLLDYKESPTAKLAKALTKEFDRLFSTKTGYAQLDERIEKTRFKKDSLLLVLEYPELPLHNNSSELGARTQARYRDISLQTKNVKGTESKDTFMTIVETSKKLGVNVFNYIFDRVSKKLEMPSLASLIEIYSHESAFNTT